MNRKIGKFKLWQLLALGAGIGFIIYEYEKGKPKGNAEGSELVASTNNPLGGGFGGGGLGEMSQPVIFPAEPGVPGPAGTPGPPGAEPATLTPQEVAEVNAIASGLNNPHPKSSKKNSPVSQKYPQTNPLTGKKYRTVHEHGKTIHVYQDGRRVVVAAKKAARKVHNPLHKESAGGNVNARSHARPKPLKAKKHATKAPTKAKVHAAPHPTQRKAKPRHKRRRRG